MQWGTTVDITGPDYQESYFANQDGKKLLVCATHTSPKQINVRAQAYYQNGAKSKLLYFHTTSLNGRNHSTVFAQSRKVIEQQRKILEQVAMKKDVVI